MSSRVSRDDTMASPRRTGIEMHRVANSRSAMSQMHKISPRVSPSPRVNDPKKQFMQ